MKKRFSSAFGSIVVALTLLVGLTACTTTNNRDNSGGGGGGGDQTSIYAAGQDGSDKAVIWKNGQVVAKTDKDGIFTSVYVHADVVYAAGQVNGYPTFWKSSSPSTYYHLDISFGCAWSVFVSGNYVYVAGTDSFWSKGKVWRGSITGNSLATYIDLGNNVVPHSVFVSGDDVYTGGWDSYGGVVWKNNTIFDSIDSESAYIYSICVSDNIVHAVGEEGGYPIYFKSNDSNDLNVYDLGSGYGFANDVSVSGGYVYVAGVDNVGGAVWRGAAGTPYPATRHISLGNVEPYSVHVLGSDVFSGGWDWVSDRGRVWRNTASLYPNLGNNSVVASVFVQ